MSKRASNVGKSWLPVDIITLILSIAGVVLAAVLVGALIVSRPSLPVAPVIGLVVAIVVTVRLYWGRKS